jgi:hypothetical protein
MRRFTAVAAIAVSLVAAIVGTASGKKPDAPPGQTKAAPATFHQTQLLSDGSTVTFTLSTAGPPAKGAGADLGTFGPAEAATKHGGTFADPSNPTRGLSSASRTTQGGSETMWGRVDFENLFGITLFTYYSQVSWDYSNWRIRDIYNHWAWNANDCCGWNYDGNDAVEHCCEGGSNFQAFAQATYKNCVFWFCESRSPWMTLQGNGAGNMTGFWWGV